MPWAYIHEHIADLCEPVAIEGRVGGFKIRYDLPEQRKLVPFRQKEQAAYFIREVGVDILKASVSA
jgi:hypothetical protein